MFNFIFIQTILNFLLTFFLLQYYLKNIKYQILYDNNPLGLGSNKKTKTGSGIIFSIILISNLLYYFLNQSFLEIQPNRFYIFIFSILLLSVISFVDDLKPLDPRLRLIFQAVIIYFSLSLIDLYYFKLPLKLMILIYLCSWIYIINITNFIDGADGYLCINAMSFFFGLIILNHFIPNGFFSFYISLILIPILVSFIYFNKPKAKLYMGDTGSILLGYVIGFCFLELISSEYWYIAIGLYFYPILDCTLTILKKIFSGVSVFDRNFSYFFQLPIKKIQKNNFNVLSISIIYNLLNLAIITFVLYFENPYLVIFSMILSFLKIRIFEILN